MNTQKLRIQKRSNGQFCTAKQFAEDMKEHETYHTLQMPPVTHNTGKAMDNLALMRKMYPQLTAAFKILLQCGIDNTYDAGGNWPSIYVGKSQITTRTCGNTYEGIDQYLLSVIDKQQKVVDLQNKTEI